MGVLLCVGVCVGVCVGGGYSSHLCEGEKWSRNSGLLNPLPLVASIARQRLWDHTWALETAEGRNREKRGEKEGGRGVWRWRGGRVVERETDMISSLSTVWGPVKVLTSSLRANYLTMHVQHTHTIVVCCSFWTLTVGSPPPLADNSTVLTSQLSLTPCTTTSTLGPKHLPLSYSSPKAPAPSTPPLLFYLVTPSYTLPLRLCGLL